ncbi:isopentenyl-diphosphate Delta-isomerase [Homoserinimonas hongtaonis]|uniref:Isopentenyl-diphosphate Delta-isomerase n=1 Tax=Homoserinimonas hongtaonis TaxID=2079791 RepID=A0A2U1T1I1_9MICO|nr:isopentenyl-diphosphate Delta-isomerase [Salinibacterium hongtaonis]AWB90295.1 isopentenyl-diphosphate delta-isomerase [Salinibacterium hongtaonis]PWB97734.1 isopentenyl-diphosphate Delta-isomerase [Salinibacterium hongtaonis]
MDATELVVLLADDGSRIGTSLKATVHTEDTPLHRAFSCHLFNESGDVLVTRRALGKATWPGVWTNSFCGHPAPDEADAAAIERRAMRELGTTVGGIEPVLPDFRYRAVDASGIVENEVCPVYRATVTSELAPSPDEIAEYRWVRPGALAEAVRAAPFAFSPWLVMQLEQWDSPL